MRYVAEHDYAMYTGQTPPDNFSSLAGLAEDMVDQGTGGKIAINGFMELSDWRKVLVKKAVCIQILWLDAHGGMFAAADDGIQSATIGRFSYSGGGESAKLSLCPAAAAYLAQTGLLYAGVTVL